MGNPRKSKDRSSDIFDKLCNLGLVAIAVSPVLFGLQQLFIFLTWTPESKKNEAEQNIRIAIRVQNVLASSDEKFAKTFDEIAMGTPIGGATVSSPMFQYKIDIQT